MIFLSPEDEYRLDQLRLERFGRLFAEALVGCELSPPVLGLLMVICRKPGQVDAVLAELPELLDFAYTVCGADRLAVYFAGEEVWAENTITMRKGVIAANLGSCDQT